jgi:phosphatidylserine synthase
MRQSQLLMGFFFLFYLYPREKSVEQCIFSVLTLLTGVFFMARIRFYIQNLLLITSKRTRVPQFIIVLLISPVAHQYKHKKYIIIVYIYCVMCYFCWKRSRNKKKNTYLLLVETFLYRGIFNLYLVDSFFSSNPSLDKSIFSLYSYYC